MTRGRLRIYLGAAPGVGKTYSMLAEGHRRASRGTDVVIGIVDNHGRKAITDLTVALDRVHPINEGDPTELDLAAILDRSPQLVLVDDMAHPLEGWSGRWQLIDRLIDSGIDVITTVGITDIESLRDVVAGITGTVPSGSVPDSAVRSADQIELVDMSPEALRRRLAHGHVFPPELVDAARANLFSPTVLGALRQLSLLWLADRVEDQLERQLMPGLVGDSPRVRERVVVALGGEGGDRLVRRAAAIAGRQGSHLIGVHVVAPGRSPGPDLERQRRLLTGLGGVYREVVSDCVSEALTEFSRVEQATQLVVGARQRRSKSREDGSVLDGLIEAIGAVDVHVISTAGEVPTARTYNRRSVLGRPRLLTVLAWGICGVGLPVLTASLSAVRGHVSVGSALMIDLCLVMVVAALGGLAPGLVASVAAFGLTNWFLTPPLHTLTVSDAENVVALTVFVIVTVVVSLLVDRAARRSRDASIARAEATALARSAGTLVGAHDPLPDLLEQLRATFGLGAASVLERVDGGWYPAHVSGSPELLDPADGTAIDLSEDGELLLVVSDDQLRPDQLELLRAFGDQLAMAVEARRLRVEAADVELLAEANTLRSSVLQAVSHDFRTPLATIKAAASGLLRTEVDFTDADRRQLLQDIDAAADRLERMVRDLLDMSRLQAGAVEPGLRPVALEEVVAVALSGIPDAPRRVMVDVSESLPLALADPGLLERALANLVSNAIAWSPSDTPVRLEAGSIAGNLELRIIDRGPGIAPAERERVLLPFQRLGDRSNDAGVGLGLAIAKGLIEAMGARLGLDDTPGGGLTLTIRLQMADEESG